MSANIQQTDDAINNFSKSSYPCQMQRISTAIQPVDSTRKRSFSNPDQDPNSSRSSRKRSRFTRNEEGSSAQYHSLSLTPHTPAKHGEPVDGDRLPLLLPSASSSNKMAISSLVRPSTRPHAAIKPPPTLEPSITPTVSQPPVSLPKLLPIATTPASWEGYKEILKQKDERAAELHRRLEAALLENEKMRSFMERVGMLLINHDGLRC